MKQDIISKKQRLTNSYKKLLKIIFGI
jgi:hypothetical protein